MIEYDPMLPEGPKKSWREMSPKEAKAFFEWFSAHIPTKMEQLWNLLVVTGFDPKNLDYSDESLVFIWQWFMKNTQADEIPEEEIREYAERLAQALRQRAIEKGGEMSDESFQRLYSNFYHEAPKRRCSLPWGFIATDIAIYLGECLIRRYPDKGISWGFFTKPRNMAGVNRPVIMGLKKRYVEKYDLNIQSGYSYNSTVDLMDLIAFDANKFANDNINHDRILLKYFRSMEGEIFQINTLQNLSDLRSMDEEEARQYFDWFTDEIMHNVRSLGMCTITNFSKDSLISVWVRFLGSVETTEREEKKKIERIQLKKKAKKPMLKMSVGGIETYEGLFIKALDISTYFAETFRRHHESKGIRWDYLTEPKTLPYVNRPVLLGFKDPANPVMDQISIFSDLAVRISKGDRNKDALMDLYQEWHKKV